MKLVQSINLLQTMKLGLYLFVYGVDAMPTLHHIVCSVKIGGYGHQQAGICDCDQLCEIYFGIYKLTATPTEEALIYFLMTYF
mmetsp:Transcript_25897/g.38689  ORF Transcript_25897/g.38689 Transcript_25897/m.38689 type:complete len:83 (-) Transcript_25897:161-409(-)